MKWLDKFKQKRDIAKRNGLTHYELRDVVSDINKRSNSDFVKRLQDPNREHIKDHESDNIATHKMSTAEVDNKTIVYPNVQKINNQLHDFTDPKHKHGKWDALDSAISRGDTLQMDPNIAEKFSKEYKQYYPGFKDGKSTTTNDNDFGDVKYTMPFDSFKHSDNLTFKQKRDLDEYKKRQFYTEKTNEFVKNESEKRKQQRISQNQDLFVDDILKLTTKKGTRGGRLMNPNLALPAYATIADILQKGMVYGTTSLMGYPQYANPSEIIDDAGIKLGDKNEWLGVAGDIFYDPIAALKLSKFVPGINLKKKNSPLYNAAHKMYRKKIAPALNKGVDFLNTNSSNLATTDKISDVIQAFEFIQNKTADNDNDNDIKYFKDGKST